VGGGGSSHSIHKAKEVGPQSTKGAGYGHKHGSVSGMLGDVFASEPDGNIRV
jgi:hypothetical protein